jgi:phosphoglucosamine mutase
MGLCAGYMADRQELKENSMVATVMSNKGFHLAMRDRGIAVHLSAVGDRYVLEEMLKRGLNLGGEQSGHIIFLDHSPTGDGLLTGLRFCAAWRDAGERLSEIAGTIPQFPQVLINVPLSDRVFLDMNALIGEEVSRVESELGDNGRVLIRPSGTEPLVRVMVEAPTLEEAEGIARELAAVIEKEIG